MKRIFFIGIFIFYQFFSPLFKATCQEKPMKNQSTTTIFPLKSTKQTFLKGYEKTLSGGTMGYHSPYPSARSALLVRATTGVMAIEWETEAVRFEDGEKFIQFIWLAGLGSNMGEKQFDMFINDSPWFTFTTADEDEWIRPGTSNSQLSFKTVMKDRHNDRFGLMTLKFPVDKTKAGQELKIKIVGRNENSNAWVMIFQQGLSESVTIQQKTALIKKSGRLLQPVAFTILHVGEPSACTIKLGERQISLKLKQGYNSEIVEFPAVETEQQQPIQIFIGENEALNQSVTLLPVRKWRIYLVQHTHTDIGYTRPQTEILPEHVRYIDYALDYCDLTDNYPDDAKFRWTCEASWPVREYLKSRPPAQIERLKKRVAEGRIEITGMMFNMSEIADENVYVDFVNPIRLFKENGLPVKTTMQNDVNGAAWCLVDYFQDTGVEYLVMGQHGHRALAPFDRPTPFWWLSPSGNRLLVFRADHYMTGNMWGIGGNNLANIESALFEYLTSLENKNYPYEKIAVQYSGYFTDNSPPSTKPCDLIRSWNEMYEWPKLRSATAQEFLDFIKENHGDDIAALRAAWPDWWTDGFGSAANETAAARKTQSDMIANLGLLSMATFYGADLPGDIDHRITAVQDALLFYDEHTFGAAESISDPMAENSVIQWAEKSAYVWDAVKNSRLLKETGMGLMQPFLPKAEVPTLTIFNTLNWERSGLHEMYIDHEILPRDREFKIVDESGNQVLAQLLSSRADGSYWKLWVEKIPPLGFKTFRIEVSLEKKSRVENNSNPVLENEFYKLEFNPKTGAIKSIFDKEMKTELVDAACEWNLGQLIYERLTDRHQLELFRLDGFTRTSLREPKIETGASGDIWTSVEITGKLEGCDPEKQVRCEVRLFKKKKRIEFHFTIRKLPVIEPEGLYVAFPFKLPEGEIVYEAQGGLVVPGKDQLPGSSSDWHTVQNFASVKGRDGQIIISSDEIPLMQFGDINLGKFQYIAEVKQSYMFSWVLNNYWTTNFKASQEGELKWSYALTSTSDTSATAATRFGWENRVPFLSRVQPASPMKSSPIQKILWPLDASNVLLVSARPAKSRNGIILHLREIEGKETILPFRDVLAKGVFHSVTEVNVLEEKLALVTSDFKLKPHGVAFLLVN